MAPSERARAGSSSQAPWPSFRSLLQDSRDRRPEAGGPRPALEFPHWAPAACQAQDKGRGRIT